VVISQEIDQELAELNMPAERRHFIPNGVDLDRFNPLPLAEKQRLRTALGLPDGPIVIYSGRLEAEKRIDQLIEIWPTILISQPNAHLVILGTGAQEAKLKQMAGKGILFIGRVEDVAPYLKVSDLFVLPSATEGLSNALLEALAAGLPAVATTVGGTPDVIAHQQNGWLIPPDMPPALQAAILALLDDIPCRNKLGHRGRERVVESYSLPATAERLRTLYDQLLNN
jgi:glycosyltransferase involved in cell wall biosynthesis